MFLSVWPDGKVTYIDISAISELEPDSNAIVAEIGKGTYLIPNSGEMLPNSTTWYRFKSNKIDQSIFKKPIKRRNNVVKTKTQYY